MSGNVCHHTGHSGQAPTHKYHILVARWMEVGSSGQFLSSEWPHYPANRIQPTKMLLGTPESLPDQPRPLRILSKEVGSCSNWHVPLCQLLKDVTYCQQLPTLQARGGGCSYYTQLMSLLPN